MISPLYIFVVYILLCISLLLSSTSYIIRYCMHAYPYIYRDFAIIYICSLYIIMYLLLSSTSYTGHYCMVSTVLPTISVQILLHITKRKVGSLYGYVIVIVVRITGVFVF